MFVPVTQFDGELVPWVVSPKEPTLERDALCILRHAQQICDPAVMCNPIARLWAT